MPSTLKYTPGSDVNSDNVLPPVLQILQNDTKKFVKKKM